MSIQRGWVSKYRQVVYRGCKRCGRKLRFKYECEDGLCGGDYSTPACFNRWVKWTMTTRGAVPFPETKPGLDYATSDRAVSIDMWLEAGAP